MECYTANVLFLAYKFCSDFFGLNHSSIIELYSWFFLKNSCSKWKLPNMKPENETGIDKIR